MEKLYNIGEKEYYTLAGLEFKDDTFLDAKPYIIDLIVDISMNRFFTSLPPKNS